MIFRIFDLNSLSLYCRDLGLLSNCFLILFKNYPESVEKAISSFADCQAYATVKGLRI